MDLHLSRHNLIIWWAWLFESRRPYHTDLCTLFWRTVLLTPLKLAGWGILGLVVSMFIVNIIEVGIWVVLIMVGGLVTIVFLVGGTIWVGCHPRVQRSAPAQAIQYVKQHYCPRIELED